MRVHLLFSIEHGKDEPCERRVVLFAVFVDKSAKCRATNPKIPAIITDILLSERSFSGEYAGHNPKQQRSNFQCRRWYVAVRLLSALN